MFHQLKNISSTDVSTAIQLSISVYKYKTFKVESQLKYCYTGKRVGNLKNIYRCKKHGKKEECIGVEKTTKPSLKVIASFYQVVIGERERTPVSVQWEGLLPDVECFKCKSGV